MDVTELIGRDESDPAVVAFVTTLGTQVCTDMFGGLRIHDYPAGGISLYFDGAGVLMADAMRLIDQLLKALGLRGLDCQSGDFFSLHTGEQTLSEWQQFRD